MGARKLYEERILELIKIIPDDKLAEVISLIEKIRQDKTEKYIGAIEEGQGRFKENLSPTFEFMKRKEQERILDNR